MAIMNFLSDIRNAALANAVIVIFHIYIAFAVEGAGFLVIVLPIGALVAGATSSAALDVIQEIHRDMKATRRKIPYSVLFTQSRAAVKSRTARHIAAQFRGNAHIDCFETEIHERDAFAAMFSMGGTVAGMSPKYVNGLDKALENIETFRAEVIARLRAIREAAEKGRAA